MSNNKKKKKNSLGRLFIYREREKIICQVAYVKKQKININNSTMAGYQKRH